MPKKSVAPTKSKSTQPASTSGTGVNRRVKPPKRKFYRRTPKRFRQAAKLLSAWQLTRRAAILLGRNWHLIGSIVLIYGLLNLLLVRGFSNLDIGSLKHSLNQVFHGSWGHLATGMTLFGVLLVSSGGSGDQVSGTYQMILLILFSLALVWTFRQLVAGQRVRLRDGFYQGMYPLVPVILVLLVIGIQLLPFIIGGTVYSIVISNAIAITSLEKFSFLLIFLLLACVSVYLLCSSVFALYIVTLPGMTPLKALRSARGLVRFRRWPLIRKLLWLPLALIVILAIILLPFILFATSLAQWVFFVLSMAALAAVHAYMYTLYRELLNE